MLNPTQKPSLTPQESLGLTEGEVGKPLQQQCQDFATMLATLTASLPDLLAQISKEASTSEAPTKKQKAEDKQAFVTASNNGGLWSILKVEFDRLAALDFDLEDEAADAEFKKLQSL